MEHHHSNLQILSNVSKSVYWTAFQLHFFHCNRISRLPNRLYTVVLINSSACRFSYTMFNHTLSCSGFIPFQAIELYSVSRAWPGWIVFFSISDSKFPRLWFPIFTNWFVNFPSASRVDVHVIWIQGFTIFSVAGVVLTGKYWV